MRENSRFLTMESFGMKNKKVLKSRLLRRMAGNIDCRPAAVHDLCYDVSHSLLTLTEVFIAMEHPATDPVADTMPSGFLDKENKGPLTFIFLLLTSIGVLLICFGAYVRWKAGQSWVPELCLGFGVAIGAPGILTYLYRRYLFDDIKAEMIRPTREFKEDALSIVRDVSKVAVKEATDTFQEIQAATKKVIGSYETEIYLLQSMRTAGVRGVYSTRSEALLAFVDFVKGEKDRIMIIGSSLRGLLQEADPEYTQTRDLLLQKKNDGIKMQFLLTHPKVADLRAHQEGRPLKAIGREIIKSLRILLHDWHVLPGEVKLYVGTPTCFGIKTGDAMLLNFYPYMQESLASPCLIVLKGSYFYNAFDRSHFGAWKSVIAQSVPVDLSQLEAKLDEYDQNVRELIGSN